MNESKTLDSTGEVSGVRDAGTRDSAFLAREYADRMCRRWNDVSFDQQPERFHTALMMAFQAGLTHSLAVHSEPMTEEA